MEYCFRKTNNNDRKEIRKLIFSVLKEAISLYENHGFKKYERKETSTRCNQAYYLNIGVEYDNKTG